MPLIQIRGCGCRTPQWEPVRKAATPDQITQAESLAAKFETKVAASIKNLLDVAADQIDLQALIDALQTGDASKVLAVVDAAYQGLAGGALINALQDTAWAAGALGAGFVLQNTPPNITEAEFHFDRLNPALVRWLKEYELGLIRQISEPTKEAVRDILVKNITEGQGAAKTAQGIKDIVGLTQRQAAAVGAFRKELETFHTKRSAAGWKLGGPIDRVNGFQVFKPDAETGKPKDGMLERRLRDFRFDGQLKKALETRKPLTPAQIDKMVAAYARKYRAYRSRVISRTETLRTTNAGIHESFRQAIEAGLLSEDLVRRRWVVARDERLCKVCAPIPKMNPKRGVRFAQPFSTPVGPVFMAPIHPQCRCSIFCYTIEPSQA